MLVFVIIAGGIILSIGVLVTLAIDKMVGEDPDTEIGNLNE
jgi:predicted ABC-type sugar transport system permease subunit